LENRDATAAVIGAGDFIGAAIAKKFASEGFIVFAGRRKEWVRERIKEREGEAALANLDPWRLMRPESVAEAYWQIYQEPVVRTRDPALCRKMVKPCPNSSFTSISAAPTPIWRIW